MLMMKKRITFIVTMLLVMCTFFGCETNSNQSEKDPSDSSIEQKYFPNDEFDVGEDDPEPVFTNRLDQIYYQLTKNESRFELNLVKREIENGKTLLDGETDAQKQEEIIQQAKQNAESYLLTAAEAQHIIDVCFADKTSDEQKIAYVSRYYGKYNDAYVVTIGGFGANGIPEANNTVTVGSYDFKLESSYDYMVVKADEWCSLEQAYKNEWLTDAHLEKIFNNSASEIWSTKVYNYTVLDKFFDKLTENTQTFGFEMYTVICDGNKKLKNATTATEESEIIEQTKANALKYFLTPTTAEYVRQIRYAETHSNYIDKLRVSNYFGKYNDAYVVNFYRNDTTNNTTSDFPSNGKKVTVAGYEFELYNDDYFVVVKGNDWCCIDKAYEQGLLTQEDIVEIYKIKQTITTYGDEYLTLKLQKLYK